MISVISLSGTSTTISSSREPSASGSFAACVAANTASPHTFPVDTAPEQNVQWCGNNNSCQSACTCSQQSFWECFHKSDTCHDTDNQTDKETGQRIDQCNIITGGKSVDQVVCSTTDGSDDRSAKCRHRYRFRCCPAITAVSGNWRTVSEIVDSDTCRYQNDDGGIQLCFKNLFHDSSSLDVIFYLYHQKCRIQKLYTICFSDDFQIFWF